MKKGKSIFITLRRRRLAGLVGDGLGDFPDRGVDSWLPAVPLAVNERISSAPAMTAVVVASLALECSEQRRSPELLDEGDLLLRDIPPHLGEERPCNDGRRPYDADFATLHSGR